MRLYFRMAVIYTAVALMIEAAREGSAAEMVAVSFGATLTTTGMTTLGLILPVVLVLAAIIGKAATLERGGQLLYAVFGVIILQLGFTFMKSSIPDMMPFYADPALAAIDRSLLFGRDAWQLAHDIGPAIDANRLLPAYVYVWSLCVLVMPAVVALTDRDEERVFRFVILRFVVWVGLGNVLAVMFASVGPVFYDSLTGSSRFAGLTAALQASGVADSAVGRLQRYLWSAYVSHDKQLGSGISAFPSVHLGIATATAIYMAERSRWLILPGAIFVAVMFYLSLYTGYHYAIDGYVSIVLILAVWAGLRLWQRARRAGGSRDIDADGGLPQSGR